MPSPSSHFDSQVRAAEKRQSRLADAQALASGLKSVAQLKRENEVFSPLAREARLDLSASRLLA